MPIFNQFYLIENKFSPQLLTNRGPILNIEVTPPTALIEQLVKQNKTPPTPKIGYALLDSGASNTCIDRNIVEELEIPAIGIQEIYTPQGSQKQNKYPAKISFPGTSLPPVEFGSVYGSTLKNQGLIALIGRDLLSHFTFTYNGPGGFITLAF